MKMVVIPRTTEEVVSNGKKYTETYFGNLVGSTADTETLAEWISTKTDYSYLDEVQIAALGTKYTSTVDAPTGHPSVSSGWFSEGLNSNRLCDNLYSSQSIFSTSPATVDFSILNMTHLIGQNLDNVASIKIQYIDTEGEPINDVFDCDKCIIQSTEISLVRYESFDCDSCCNPPPVLDRQFIFPLEYQSCGGVSHIHITFTPYDDSKSIAVGNLAVGHAHDIGCAQYGMSRDIEIPENVTEFTEIEQTGVRPVNIEKTYSGSLLADALTAKNLENLIQLHGAYLNFFLLDDAGEDDVILGRCTRLSVPAGTGNKVIPIEIFGIQT